MLSKTNIEYNIKKYKEYDDIFKFDITINLWGNQNERFKYKKNS
jgi:hypothetical protein